MSIQLRGSWRTKAGASLLSAGVLAGGFAGVAAAQGGGGHGAGRNGGVFSGLTQAQRACIRSQGVTRHRGRPTLQERRAIHAAAETCGVNLPDPAARNPAKQGGKHHRYGGRWGGSKTA